MSEMLMFDVQADLYMSEINKRIPQEQLTAEVISAIIGASHSAMLSVIYTVEAGRADGRLEDVCDFLTDQREKFFADGGGDGGSGCIPVKTVQ